LEKRHYSMFSPFGFSIQEFFFVFLIVKNRPLYVNFIIPPCGK
jgi:hypothetical protein